MIHPFIKYRLSQARNAAEAQAVWRDHLDELAGYTFVISGPTGNNALQLPARLDFPGGGHLRSAFTHDGLYFINHDLIARTLSEGFVSIPVDYSVGFDSNVASHLRDWHRGRTAEVVSKVQAVVRALRAGKLNWDMIPFLLERSNAILEQRDLAQIYETELAVRWLGAADSNHFAQSGQVRLTCSEGDLAIQAQRALGDWDRLLRNGYAETIAHRFDLSHACVLKLALLHLEEPGVDAAAAKLERFLGFLDAELHCMMLLFVRIAMEFFAKGGACKPLAKIASRSHRLCEHARNVTWDCLHLVWRHECAGFNGRNDSFLVPYFLTFDQGLAELFDLYPQRSCLFGGELRFPLFFQEVDIESLLRQQYPQLSPVVARIFTPQAAERRRLCLEGTRAPATAIAADLERRLADFEGDASPLKPLNNRK